MLFDLVHASQHRLCVDRAQVRLDYAVDLLDGTALDFVLTHATILQIVLGKHYFARGNSILRNFLALPFVYFVEKLSFITKQFT